MTDPSQSDAVRLAEVEIRFGSLQVLKDVSLVLGRGEIIGVVGPSGAGKTTLFRLINGLETPGAGRVSVLGLDLVTLSARELRELRRRIAWIPQDLALVSNMSVLQNVLQGSIGSRGFLGNLKAMLYPDRSAVEAVYELLCRTGIGEKLYQKVETLSLGQQQRVALARALYQRPAVILADEPVSSLDPTRADEALRLLVEVAGERNIALLVSIHHVELAREILPRLVGLRKGRVLKDGPTSGWDDTVFAELFESENNG